MLYASLLINFFACHSQQQMTQEIDFNIPDIVLLLYDIVLLLYDIVLLLYDIVLLLYDIVLLFPCHFHVGPTRNSKRWVIIIASKINVTPNGPKGVRLSFVIITALKLHSVMKFDRSNKFDSCYYGEENTIRLKSSVASILASKHIWG